MGEIRVQGQGQKNLGHSDRKRNKCFFFDSCSVHQKRQEIFKTLKYLMITVDCYHNLIRTNWLTYPVKNCLISPGKHPNVIAKYSLNPQKSKHRRPRVKNYKSN